jgi:hypothetical protein
MILYGNKNALVHLRCIELKRFCLLSDVSISKQKSIVSSGDRTKTFCFVYSEQKHFCFV